MGSKLKNESGTFIKGGSSHVETAEISFNHEDEVWITAARPRGANVEIIHKATGELMSQQLARAKPGELLLPLTFPDRDWLAGIVTEPVLVAD